MGTPLTGRRRIEWWVLCAAFWGLIGFGLYSECTKMDGFSEEVRHAMTCVIGPPPVTVAEVDARYQLIHKAAAERGLEHPAACAPYFVDAGHYRGSGSGTTTRGIKDIAKLLRSGDEAAILQKFRWLVEEYAFDQPR